MKMILPLILFSVFSWAQNSMDHHRWYLDPHGQEVIIGIDDLHDEKIPALSTMDWGRSLIQGIRLEKKILIAVIDGGFDIEHPELKDHVAFNEAECYEGKIIPPKDEEDRDNNGYKGDCAGWDFVQEHNRPEDEDGHGTHVTGVIHSVLSGIQGEYKFLPLKVFAPNEGTKSVQAKSPLHVRLHRAFEYAISRKVDMIHLSVGWPKSFMTHELEQTMKRAINKGILIVAAAGNSSQRAAIYPCQMEGVLCVGALRPNGEVARFSNWGPQVDLFAPGEKILSTIPYTVSPLHISRKGYDFKNGTSQAAPFVTAAMAILKGSFPTEDSDTLYTRLISGADEAISRSGLKGMFRPIKALMESVGPFVFPRLKGLTSILVDRKNHFKFKIPFKNFGTLPSLSLRVQLQCAGAQMTGPDFIEPLFKGQSETLEFEGKLNIKIEELECDLILGSQKVPLSLKIVHELDEARVQHVVAQDDILVINTRTGGRSHLMTLGALGDTNQGPLYYVFGANQLILYKREKKLGTVPMKKGCVFLRAWQVDLIGDKENEILIEAICNKTHLFYEFIDLELKEIWPGVKYRPALTVINYDDFELVKRTGLPPSFRFISLGLVPPSDSVWEDSSTSQALHYYELFATRNNHEWYYDVRVLENSRQWAKELGLRYMPSWQIFHQIKDRLLIQIGKKTAWVDLKTQKATWANLDHLLLLGSKKQRLHGTDQFILQSFLTPFEYRGHILEGPSLRFIQKDLFDPMLDVIGTQLNQRGHLSVVRSFQKLHYLQFDFTGALIEHTEKIVERFDFLTAQDLIASVANLVFKGKMIQIVDGTKVNTDYVDVIKETKKIAYKIPFHCVTQQPIVLDDRPTLPVFCGKSRHEFEMRFIDL